MGADNLEKAYDAALFSLKRKIKGYRVAEKKTSYIIDPEGNKVIKDESVTTKYYPPDLSAIIFVLTNRAPFLWKQKPGEVAESGGDDRIPDKPDLSLLSETTLRELSELCK